MGIPQSYKELLLSRMLRSDRSSFPNWVQGKQFLKDILGVLVDKNEG